MRVLVLDDDKERHTTFAKVFEREDIKHVWTVDDCCSALSKDGPWDLVHLDHDLNDFQRDGHSSLIAGMYGGQVELTGVDVAVFIARHLDPAKRPSKIVVHSWNPPGAKMMVDILSDAGMDVVYSPFDPQM